MGDCRDEILSDEKRSEIILRESEKKSVYIIAEMSANHAGRLENALRIVREAAAAGADCVKIQTYTADTLTIPCERPEFIIHGGLWDGYTYYDLYRKAYTPWEWQSSIKEECERVGVDFLSTPFDRTAVDFLEKLGVSAYKIASYELIDTPLIRYTAECGKPMIISCGMGTKKEIQDAVDACRDVGNDRIILLKCCSEYPADPEDMNLRLMSTMRKEFGAEVGLSDHSSGYEVPVLAVAAGATVVEKHVMLDDAEDNPDKGFSMKMSEFAEMVKHVRRAETVLGSGEYRLSEREEKARSDRRSLYVVKEIKKGERFTGENIRSIRPGYGLSPKEFENIVGRTAARDIAYGTPLEWGMVESGN